MANSWWERFQYAAPLFKDRILEEIGAYDIAEELARFDDDDMSVADYASAAFGAWHQTAGMAGVFPQALITGAVEVNRLYGADARASISQREAAEWDLAKQYGITPKTPERPVEVGRLQAFEDFLSGGYSAEQRAEFAQQIGPDGKPRGEAAARALYSPVSLSDAYAVAVDKDINRYGRGLTQGQAGLASVPYRIGSLFNPVDGVQSNGSYLPSSFDAWTQDGGSQLWERSGMTHQLIASQMVVEGALDPLNFAAGPIASGIRALRSGRLVLDGKNTITAAEVDQGLALIAGSATEQNQWMRMRQSVSGFGLWTPQRFLSQMANNPNQRRMLETLAAEGDVGVIRRWIERAPNGPMADGEGADVLASVLSKLDTPEDVAAGLMAFAYRDTRATERTLAALERSFASAPVMNEFKTLTGVGKNILEEAPFQFGDGPLPEGHLLLTGAREFVEHALDNAAARMDVPDGAPNPLREQWDSLVSGQQDAVVKDIQGWQSAMVGAQRMLTASPDGQILKSIPRGTAGAGRLVDAATGAGDLRTTVKVGNWISEHFIPSMRINGRSTRTSASVWLVARPGLTFSLHGLDAVARFDDVIQYVDGIVSGTARQGGTFANDAVVKSLRDEFIQAGAITRSPEQMRANLINQLQTRAIAAIAENRGATPEAAQLIAEAGMQKSDLITKALNSAEEGYTTTIVQDGLPLILAGHPSTVRQTANFIPIMDLKAVDDALKSKGMQSKAYLSPDRLISEASVREELDVLGNTGRAVSRLGRNFAVQKAHDVTDAADIVMSLFKAQVLLRLGYPVRNLSEAHLSAYASGLGWMDVMSHANIPSLLGNFGTNLWTTPRRVTDRVKTYWGLTSSEDAYIAAAQSIDPAIRQSTANLSRLAMAATREETVNELVRLINTADPETAAQAASELRYLLDRRLRAAHRLSAEMLDDELLSDQARMSGTYWHVDPTGDSVQSLTSNTANGPVSVVSDPVVAQANLDAAWQPSAWENADLPKNSGSLPANTFTPKQREVLRQVAETFPSSKWKIGPKGEVKFSSGVGLREMFDSFDDHIASLQKRVDDLDQAIANPAPRPQAPETMVFTRGNDGTHAVNTGHLIQKNAEGRWEIWEKGAQKPIGPQYRKLQDAKDAIIRNDLYTATGATLRQQRATAMRELAAAARMRSGLEDTGKWASHQSALAKQAEGAHVQFRVNEESPWVDWSGQIPYAGGGGRTGYQFRTIPKGKAGARPQSVELDVWGAELDLTDTHVVDAVIGKFKKIDPKTIGEARAGDRAAQVRLSNLLAEEGYYRVKFPEGAQWNGEHVMIHPKGVGERAYKEFLEDEMRATVDAAVRDDVDVALLSSWTARKAANRGKLSPEEAQQFGAPEIPKAESSSARPADVIRRGGYDALLEEAIDKHINLMSQRATINAAYLKRQRDVAKFAKKRGIGAKQWTIQSAYNGFHVVDDLLHGPDGGAYAQVTSGDVTQAMVYANGVHQAEILNDMGRAIMNPEEIYPGDPRYFDAAANLFGRQLRDTPGAVTAGGVTVRDVDPVILRALESTGERERLIDETIEWALDTQEGRNWLNAMGLRGARDLDEAKALADAAAARRGVPEVRGVVDRQQARTQRWQETLDSPVLVNEVEVGDVIRAQFNFVDNFMPTDEVRDLFLRGEATADALRAAHARNPWELKPFNGLTLPTHRAYRRTIRNRRAAEEGMSIITSEIMSAYGKMLQRIGSGPETRLARHPVYLAIGKADLQQRVTYSEAVLGRKLNLDELLAARSAAQKFAVRKMEETLYTLKSRSSVDDFMRFIMPFFPAWRNTASRWGKFAMTNPGGVAKVGRLYNSAFGEMPFYDSATGEQVDLEAVDPGEAFTLMKGIGTWIPGWKDDPAMKEAMRRTKLSPRSLDIIFQGDAFNPGFGPFVAVPVQAILQHFNGLAQSGFGKELAKWFLPMGPQNTGSSLTDAAFQFLPSALKPAANRIFSTQSYVSTRNRVGNVYIENGYGEGKTDGEIDKEIDTATMKLLAIKTLTYLVSPVSSQQVGDHEFYAGQYRSLLQTQPDSQTADVKFLERFGADKWLYTRSSTANLTGGMATSAVVSNQRALDAEVNDLATSTYNDPRLLAWLENLGPDGESMPYDAEAYNPYARNWQMKNAPGTSTVPYRGTKEFFEQKRDAEVQLGWRYYDAGMDRLDLQLQSEGYTMGSPQFVKERADRSSQVASIVSQKIPAWEDARKSIDTGKTERNAEFFRDVFTNTEWGKSRRGLASVEAIMGYLTDRETARAAIAQRQGQPGAAKSLSGAANEDIGAWLAARRELYAQSSLSFDVWQKQYFRNDNVTYNPYEVVLQ